MLPKHVLPQQGAPVSTAIFPCDSRSSSRKLDEAITWMMCICVRGARCAGDVICSCFRIDLDINRAIHQAIHHVIQGAMDRLACVGALSAARFRWQLSRDRSSLPACMRLHALAMPGRWSEPLQMISSVMVRWLSSRNVMNLRPADFEPLPAVGLSRHRD